MNSVQNGQLPTRKIELVQQLLTRIYDPASTVKEIARLVDSIPMLRNHVLGSLKEQSGGRISVRNCAQAIILIGFNQLSRLASLCLEHLSKQLDVLANGPHRLTPPANHLVQAADISG
jgi:hypothetical protein